MPKARSTCTQCSIRRQKCDRSIPCERCVRRGVPELCTRSWSDTYDTGRASGDRRGAGETVTSGCLTEEHGDGSGIVHAAVERDLREARAGDSSSGQDALQDENDESPATSWRDTHGRDWSHIGDDDHHCSPVESEGAATPARPSAFGLTGSLDNTAALLQLQLPSVTQIYHLVDYHESFLLWYHGCYHGPTFRKELKEALDGADDILSLDDLNLQWVALLFSIMAGSLTCATERMMTSWGFWIGETNKLARQWYKATVTCLNAAEYTSNHQIYAVHAITTLSMSAHTLGLSEDLSVLLGAALKIARSLGLDRLNYLPDLDTVTEDTTMPQRQKVLRREIGRRLWSQLCVQDWFSLPFAESQCIGLTDFITSKPSNRDHITMDTLPDSFPTYISYGNYLYDIAKLIAEHHMALQRSSTPYTRYEQVLEHDARMRNLARQGMPKYFHVTADIDPSWPKFIPWARVSLTICFAHKIMMIHRPFIKSSFTNPAFQVTRATCIAASKTILKEAKREQEGDGPIIWIDQAFCIAAGIVLCLDVMHRHAEEPEFQVHINLVNDCIDMLRKSKDSMVATRGIELLTTLLAERRKLSQPVVPRRKRGRSSGIALTSDGLQAPKRRGIDISPVFKSLAVRGQGERSLRSIPPGVRYSISTATLNEETASSDIGDGVDCAIKRFAELLPPQAGFSNNFLFDTLLDFPA